MDSQNWWKIHRNKTKQATMKTLTPIALVAVIAALGSTVCVAQCSLSPKAAEFRNELRKVPASPNEVDLVSNRPAGNAAGWSLAKDFRKVPSTGRDVNLAHGPRPAFAPKDPRYDAALRLNPFKQFNLAKTTTAE